MSVKSVLTPAARIAAAERWVDQARDEARELLQRANVHEGIRFGRDARRLSEAFKARGMHVEASKVRNVVDALAELYQATQSYHAPRSVVRPRESRLPQPQPVPVRNAEGLITSARWAGNDCTDPNPPAWHWTVPPWEDGPAE